MQYWHEVNLSDWRRYEKKGDRWLPWKQYIRHFVQARFDSPANLAGRGIVIPAGGKYITGAWLTVKLLREYGCKLPVEIWHLGPEEIPDFYRQALSGDPLTSFVDALSLQGVHPTRKMGGWQLKPYSIILSRFEEVLLIDADNHPAKDPTFLFDDPDYRKTGALFWPDRMRHGKNSSLWELFDVPYRDEWAHETGQIVLNKRKCWHALQISMHLNEHSNFHYQHSHGDTATFRFALHALEQDFSLIPHRMAAIPLDREVGDLEEVKRETVQRFCIANRDDAKEYIDMPTWDDIRAVFLQMAPDGSVLFEHRSGGGGGQCAFQPGGENIFIRQFPMERRCHELIAELRDAIRASDNGDKKNDD